MRERVIILSPIGVMCLVLAPCFFLTFGSDRAAVIWTLVMLVFVWLDASTEIDPGTYTRPPWRPWFTRKS